MVHGQRHKRQEPWKTTVGPAKSSAPKWFDGSAVLFLASAAAARLTFP
jgi:hypothetical protein